MRGLPEMVGFGVGVGNGLIGENLPTHKHAPLIYRGAVLGYGLYRALFRNDTSADALDITYALISAPIAIEAIYVPGAIKGGGIKALGHVIPVPEHAHAEVGCSGCAAARAEALRSPAESLDGYAGY